AITNQHSNTHPQQNCRCEYSVDKMPKNSDTRVSEGGAEKHLQIYHRNRNQRKCARAGTACILADLTVAFEPGSAGEEGHQHTNTEECLTQGRRGGRNIPGKECQYSNPAEYSLQNDTSQGCQAQFPHPRTRIGTKSPDAHHNREKTHELSEHAMTMF